MGCGSEVWCCSMPAHKTDLGPGSEVLQFRLLFQKALLRGAWQESSLEPELFGMFFLRLLQCHSPFGQKIEAVITECYRVGLWKIPFLLPVTFGNVKHSIGE